MLLMGVIALFQVILLPGLIISILLGIRGVILTTLLSFALSLLVNYQLVFCIDFGRILYRKCHADGDHL
jgi:hypothetical protein